jgi:DNA modification methylase
MRERSNSNEAPPRPVARQRPGRMPNGPQGCIGLTARLADDRSAKANDLEITYVCVEVVREYKNHARVHDKKALAKAKALLSAHGQIVPIVIDENGEILDGVLQHRALLEMGHDQVRVIIVRNRDPAALKAIRLALNRLPQDAKWDAEKLRAEFSSLIELDYDVTLTGFETAQIDMVFAVDEPAATAVEVESAESLTPPDVPVVKLGDKWRLGRHVVACGDARDEAFLADLVGEAKASAAILDLPYNLPIAGFVSGKGKKTHREFAMASGEMTPAQFTDFLAEAIKALKLVLMPGAVCYFFLDWRHTGELLEAGKRNDLTPLNLCIWVKTNPGMGSFYRSAHELCFVYKHGSATHINNFELGQHGRSRSNVWTYAGMNVFGKDRDALLTMHPTVKPLPLLVDMIKDVTKRGALIIDTFIGSGSTLLAAEETGRICAGVELDPGYVEVAIRRWQQRTGKDAVHTVTGETFDEFCKRHAEVAAAPVSIVETIEGQMPDVMDHDSERSDD